MVSPGPVGGSITSGDSTIVVGCGRAAIGVGVNTADSVLKPVIVASGDEVGVGDGALPGGGVGVRVGVIFRDNGVEVGVGVSVGVSEVDTDAEVIVTVAGVVVDKTFSLV